jgi:outer membrane lipoprotein-sorting protein
MRPHTFRGLVATVLAVFATSAAGAALQSEGAQTGDAWSSLEQVRRTLARNGATEAQFEQTFVAAGFSAGDSESGQLAFSLPDCLRWDYADPYPKSFLVCQDTAWYWNESDGSGRRQELDSRNEPGLDLLLLSVDSLAERYTASAEPGDEGTVVLALQPRQTAGEIASAWLTLDPAAGRVLRLEYLDLEGNRTTFAIRGYRPLTGPDRFTPPSDIRWEESR